MAIEQRWCVSGPSAEPLHGCPHIVYERITADLGSFVLVAGPGEGSDLGRWARPGSGELTGMAVRRGVFHAVPDLIASIEKYMAWTRMTQTPLDGGDAEALELAIQGRAGDPQRRGCLDPVSVRVAEGLDDCIALECLHAGELTSGSVVAVTR